MLKIRCFRCGNYFTLSEQLVANALAAEGVTHAPTHYTAECPRCRRANKVSLKGVHLPPPEPLAEPPAGEPSPEG